MKKLFTISVIAVISMMILSFAFEPSNGNYNVNSLNSAGIWLNPTGNPIGLNPQNVTATYFTESFEGTWTGTPAAPPGWTIVHTTATGGSSGTDPMYWAKNTWSGSAWSITPYGGTPTTPTGSYDLSSVAWFNDGNAKATQKDELRTGNIDLSTSTSPRVTFYLALSASSSLTLKVRASSDGGATFNDIQTLTKPGVAWTKMVVNLPAAYKVSNARIGIEVTASWGSYDIFVDKFVVDDTPPPLTGTKTIKSSGGDYATFTAAINALNDAGVGSNGVTFNVDDDLVLTEDPPIITATGTSGNPIVFQRTGTGTNRPIIKPTGGAGTSDAGIVISGGDYITFNGIDITVNSGTALEYGYLIRNASTTNGATNNTIQNCNITLNRGNTSSIGILQSASTTYGGGNTPGSDLGTNSNNHYYNFTVKNAYNGIWLYNGSGTYFDANNEVGITGGGTTIIGDNTANDIGNGASTTYGIRCYFQKDTKVFNTEVRNLTQTSTGLVYGISFTGAYGTSSVYNNKVHDMTSSYVNTSTTPKLYGLELGSSSTQTLTAYNNIVYNFSHAISSASATVVAYGIYVSTTGTTNLYFNSVRMNLGANASNQALYVSGANTNVKNNVFANFSTYNATSKRYCYYASSSPLSSSNNILYIDNSAGANNLVGYGSTADRASLQLFAASISGTAPVDGNEGGSANANPNFTSATDLTLSGSSPARNSGTPVAGISTDIANISRDASRPNIGAYETSVTQTDNSAPVISNISITSGLTPSVSCLITDNSAATSNATVQLWYRLSTSSGAYTGVDADSKPSGAINGTYSWSSSALPSSSGTYNFYIAARDGAGVGSNIWVNPMWTTGWTSWAAGDPPNFGAINPDAAANVRTFQKTATLAGGTYDVGTSQPVLKKLTDVANQLNNSQLTGNVIYELNSDYDGTAGETFPITFNQFSDDNGSRTVTIRVKSGAGARTTSGSSATDLIALNGADRITFDGRENGAGSTKAWTISNTGAGTTFNLINDAISNNFQYLTIKGVGTSGTAGTFTFGTATSGTVGNDNNTINYCDLLDGATTPRIAVYSSGSSSKENSGNIISNSNIANYFTAATNCYGIYLSSNNTDWTISNNKIYQGASRTFTTSGLFYYGINISSGNNYSITGNIIGFGASDGTGTTTITGSSNMIRPIYLTVGTVTATSVQGNIIAGISQTSSRASTTTSQGAFVGIYYTGLVNVGNISGNTIGSLTGTGNITIAATSTTSSTAPSMGILNYGSSNTNISNNNIGSISVTTGGAGTYVGFTGIRITSSTGTLNTIFNNTIGGTTANSISVAPVNGQLLGLYTTVGVNTITSNTITNLTHIAANTGTGSSASVIGIYQASSDAGQLVSQNKINTLSNTVSASAVQVIGLAYSGATTGTNIVSRNFIHSFALSSTSTSAAIYGIYTIAGLTNYQNNMIRLGIDAAGSGIATGYSIMGIYDNIGTNSFYHNSVYIGGTSVSGTTSSTYAFNSSVTANTRAFQNNIFANERSGGTTGIHYAIGVGGSGVNPTGLTCNFNLLLANGTNGKLGRYNSTDYITLTAWTTANGQDGNSAFTTLLSNINFANATGNSTAVDLHLTPAGSTAAEGSGTNIASVTDDYDAETRSVLTPVDIGADAGDFTAIDIFPPKITYTALTNTSSTIDRTLSSVTITDGSGVPTSGTLQPRIYYRKAAGTWYSSQGTLSSGSGTNGVWSFTIVVADMGGVALNDVISYYVIAQDGATTPNISSTPSGVIASDVNTITTPPTPNTYTILGGISGTKNVPGDYPTLTGVGGLFAAINSGVLTSNLIVNITADITEVGTNALNQWSEDGLGGYTLTIQPDAASMRTISGSYAGGLIRLNGADRVTFNGNFSNSGQYLTFSNTNVSTSNFTISLNNTANNNTIKNCKIYSAYQTINITNSDNTLIEANDIYGDVAGNTNYYQAGIYLTTGSTNTKIRRNTIHDFYYTGSTGFGCFGIRFSSDATTVTEISNNAIYNIKADGEEASNLYYAPAGISIESGGNIQIYNNSIYMSGTTLGYSSGTSCGSVIQIHSAATLLDIRNNALRNSMSGSTSSSYAINIYLIRSLAGTSAFTNLDYNDYYYTTGSYTTPYIGYLTSTPYSTLATWRGAVGTSKDVYSVSGDPGFTSTTSLLPDAGTANSWNISGKGVQISTITTDITGASRSITLAGGAPDIGAYEFATPSVPPNDASPSVAGDVTTYSVAGNTVVKITRTAGTLPTITVKYRSGKNPDNTIGGSKFANLDWDVTGTGGDAYTYTIELFYTTPLMGTISAEDKMRLAKYSLGSWTQYDATPNQSTKSITVTGLSSFSQFTFGDADAPLPVMLSSFTSNVNGRDVKLQWTTASEINNSGFEIERKEVGKNVWNKAGFVNGMGTKNTPTNYNFDDKKLNTGKYNYRLKQVDNNGNFEYHNLSTVIEIGIPTKYDLSQNYPNPFNPTTKIDYALPFDSKVSIILYDITGREVKTLVNNTMKAGFYTDVFNLSNLSSGTYFYRLIAKSSDKDYVATKKMVLVK